MKNIQSNRQIFVSTAMGFIFMFMWEAVLAGSFTNNIYVTLKKANQVAKFPGNVVWEGGPNMLYDALTPDGKVLMVTSPSEASVYVFDTKTGRKLSKIKVGKAPKGVKISPDGQQAYVSNQNDASISVIDVKKLQVVNTITTEQGPHNTRFNRDGLIAYVTLQGGAGLGVIDTKVSKMIDVIPLPGLTGPHNLDLSADESIAYVRDIDRNVAIVDLNKKTVKKVIQVGNGHAGIDATQDGRYVFTGAIGDTYVSVIDPVSMKLVKKVEVGDGPHGVRASADSRYLYVAVTGSNQLVTIDIATLKVVARHDVGEFPFWIAAPGNP